MKIYSTCEYCQDRYITIYTHRKYCQGKECLNKRKTESYHKRKKEKNDIEKTDILLI